MYVPQFMYAHTITMQPFDVYCLYIALKNHFTTKSYDFFKYKGKTKVTAHSFETRPDRIFYKRLANKYNTDQMQDYLVANFMQGKKWIGDFLDADAEENYYDYLKIKDALTYQTIDIVQNLFVEHSAKDLFSIKSGSYPIILEKTLAGEIPLPVFVVLNDFFAFYDALDKKLGKDDVIWSKIKLRASKLGPFLKYDKSKVKECLRNVAH